MTSDCRRVCNGFSIIWQVFWRKKEAVAFLRETSEKSDTMCMNA
jgi:hypothetical protein